MEKNLFEQAKDMMTNLMNPSENEQNSHSPDASDKEAARKVIKAAYQDASPEEKAQLEQFEQQLDNKIQLH